MSQRNKPKYVIKSDNKFLKFKDNRMLWVDEDFNDYPSRYAAKVHLEQIKVITGLSFVMDDFQIEKV